MVSLLVTKVLIMKAWPLATGAKNIALGLLENRASAAAVAEVAAPVV